MSKDNNAALAQLEAFATAYNDLLKFFGEQSTAAASGKPASVATRSSAGCAMRCDRDDGSQGGAGDFGRLAEVGVGFDGTGKIVIEDELFQTPSTRRPRRKRAVWRQMTAAAGSARSKG